MKKKFLLFLAALLRFYVSSKFATVLLLILVFVSAFLHAQNKTGLKHAKSSNASVTTKKSFRYAITGNEQIGFGYDVFEGTRMLIRQPNIPGLTGNKGFATKGDAEKTAKLAIKKLANNIMPPTISKQELENLKIKI